MCWNDKVYSLTRRGNIFFTTLQNACLEYEVSYVDIGDQFDNFRISEITISFQFFKVRSQVSWNDFIFELMRTCTKLQRLIIDTSWRWTDWPFCVCFAEQLTTQKGLIIAVKIKREIIMLNLRFDNHFRISILRDTNRDIIPYTNVDSVSSINFHVKKWPFVFLAPAW